MKETLIDKIHHLYTTSIVVFMVVHGFLSILLFAAYGGITGTKALLLSFSIGIIYSTAEVPKEFPNRIKNPKLFSISLSVLLTIIATFMLNIENLWIEGFIIFLGFLWGWFGNRIMERFSSNEKE